MKATREEIKECVANALKRVIAESRNRYDDDDYNYSGKDKRKGPKHAKMQPQKKEKYRGGWDIY